MTKLQILAAIINFILAIQTLRALYTTDNSGGEDAMSAVVETFVYIAALVIFDLAALVIHLWMK